MEILTATAAQPKTGRLICCAIPFRHWKTSLRCSTVSVMSTVQEIESALDGLPQADLLALVDRLRGRHVAAWGRQIEADAQNGRLAPRLRGGIRNPSG